MIPPNRSFHSSAFRGSMSIKAVFIDCLVHTLERAGTPALRGIVIAWRDDARREAGRTGALESNISGIYFNIYAVFTPRQIASAFAQRALRLATPHACCTLQLGGRSRSSRRMCRLPLLGLTAITGANNWWTLPHVLQPTACTCDGDGMQVTTSREQGARMR